MTDEEWVKKTTKLIWDWDTEVEKFNDGFLIRSTEATLNDNGTIQMAVFYTIHNEDQECFATEQEAWTDARKFLVKKLKSEIEDYEEMISDIKKCLDNLDKLSISNVKLSFNKNMN